MVASVLECDTVGFEERRRFASALGLDGVCLHPRLVSSAGGGLPAADEQQWPDLSRWVSESDRFVFTLVDGPFGWGARLLGLEGFLMTAHRNALEMVKFVRLVENLNLELIRRASDSGAMGILVADDFAYQQGLFVSPGLIRSLFLPSLASLAEEAHRNGLFLFFHCDGNINSVLHDLAETGIDGLQGLESTSGMDLRSAREQCGDRLCLWGNLDPRVLLPPVDPARLLQSVAEITSVAAAGGLIFGTSSGLFSGMDPDGIRALYPLT